MALARFGVFELDEAAGALRRQGRLVHLTGQPLKALHLLVSRPGEVVTREELRRHIWGDSRFVDFDRNLNFCIATVRDALGDSARSPRFIETVPRRGYRFIADVIRPEIEPPQPEVARGQRDADGLTALADRVHPSTGPRQVSRRWFWAALAAFLLIQGPAPNPAHTRTTTTAEALSAFERGLADVSSGDEGRRRSVYRFREAIRLDPTFAEAHYALADVYLDLAGRRELPAEAALAQARSEALRAIALEEVAATRTVLGVVRLVRDWDWQGARREHLRSLAAEPNSDAALTAYARYLSAAGESSQAIATIDRAEALSPSCDLVLWESALIRYRAGRQEEALDKARRALAYAGDSGNWKIHVAWLSLLIHVDRREWALAAVDARTIGGRAEETRAAVLAFVRHAAVRAAGTTGRDRRPVWTATMFAAAGEEDAALSWLERAAAERDPDLLYGLQNPAFDTLRQTARFQRLILATNPS
jgi:DNA-binding winged helix-turn-helix (wHTH) protein